MVVVSETVGAPVVLPPRPVVEPEVVPGGLYSYASKVTGAVTMTVNGKSLPATPDRLGYVTVARAWKRGDAVEQVFVDACAGCRVLLRGSGPRPQAGGGARRAKSGANRFGNDGNRDGRPAFGRGISAHGV